MRNPRSGSRAPAFAPVEDDQPDTEAGALPFKLGFLLARSRYKIIYGGRGSAKSWSAARALLLRGAEEPLRILCTREFQNSLLDSSHRLLADQVVELGLSDFYTVQKKTIIGANGTVFIFAGLRHNISKIKSFEGADIVWVEEGQNVSKQSYDVLIPTIRKPGSEIWVTFNPDLEEDEAYQRFVVWPQADSKVQKVNWNDNPWFPEELRREKDHLKARDLEAYNNVWEGHCRSHVAGALWTKEMFAENRDAAPENEAGRAKLLATLRRVVISIDPSGCSGEQDRRADEIGIIATGVGHDGIARVLEDATGRYSPNEWAIKTLEVFADVQRGGPDADALFLFGRRTIQRGFQAPTTGRRHRRYRRAAY